MQRRMMLLGGAALTALGGCSAGPDVFAPQEDIDRVFYRHPGPPSITLFTMKNTASDNGAHTGLMVNASQRVIFDPAGSWSLSIAPERNDVHYGVTPQVEFAYVSAHARETYYVMRHDVVVSEVAAETCLRLVERAGPVPRSACTRATGQVLRQVPGFEGIRPALFPDNLMQQFAALPGAVETVMREHDADDKDIAIREFEAQLRAEGVL